MLDTQSIIKIAVEPGNISYPLLVKMSVIYYDNNTFVCLHGGEWWACDISNGRTILGLCDTWLV